MIYLCYVLSGLGFVFYLSALFFRGESLEFPLAQGGQAAMITAVIILLLELPPELRILNKT
jgi:hypothetical protein